MTTAILASNTLNAHPLFVALMNSTDFESISTLLGGTLGDERKAFLATTDSNGDTALIKAVKAAPWKVASGLMTIGADVNATNREGRTALHYAVERATTSGEDVNRDWLVGLLIARNASVTIADNTGTTAYDMLAAAGYKKLNKLTLAA